MSEGGVGDTAKNFNNGDSRGSKNQSPSARNSGDVTKSTTVGAPAVDKTTWDTVNEHSDSWNNNVPNADPHAHNRDTQAPIDSEAGPS